MTAARSAWSRADNGPNVPLVVIWPDLTVFSGDPIAVEPAAPLGLDVSLAVVGGKVEHVHPDHADLAAPLS